MYVVFQVEPSNWNLGKRTRKDRREAYTPPPNVDKWAKGVPKAHVILWHHVAWWQNTASQQLFTGIVS